MKSATKNTFLVSAIFISATLVAFVVLNRWIVTDIGLLSYGRIWQLYVSYSDFGFVRRSLIGTIFSESGFNSIFKNEYHFALFIHHAAIVFLASIVAHYCISQKIKDPTFLALIAFSPALIIHSGYSTGTLDVFVLILAAINILYVRNLMIFSIIVIAGIFTHELFLFTAPAQFFAFIKRRHSEFEATTYRDIAIMMMALFIALVAITIFGKTDLTKDTFEHIMRQRIPIAEGQHRLWSGYFEIGSTFERNASGSIQRLFDQINSGIIYMTIPLIYISILIIRLKSYSDNKYEFTLMAIVVIAPLLTALVATDYYRWIAMSANMGLLLTLVLAAQKGTTASRWNVPLLLFCALAPFGGAAIDRPFPMHQFILEKLLQ